jgi:hypothetical protein
VPRVTLDFDVVNLPGCLGGVLTVTEALVLFEHPPAFVIVYLIVAVPAETPFTTPVLAFTVAIDVFKLLQTPPVVASVKVVEPPRHTDLIPPIESGAEGIEAKVTVTLPFMAVVQPVVEYLAETV